MADPVLVQVGFQSWAGLTWHPATLVGETPKRYRVRWLETFFSGRRRAGTIQLVPKHAVRFGPPSPGEPERKDA
jgi:hypothetical protein